MGVCEARSVTIGTGLWRAVPRSQALGEVGRGAGQSGGADGGLTAVAPQILHPLSPYCRVLAGREHGEVTTATLGPPFREPSLRGRPALEASDQGWPEGTGHRGGGQLLGCRIFARGLQLPSENTWCLIHLFINSLNPQHPVGSPAGPRMWGQD